MGPRGWVVREILQPLLQSLPSGPHIELSEFWSDVWWQLSQEVWVFVQIGVFALEAPVASLSPQAARGRAECGYW